MFLSKYAPILTKTTKDVFLDYIGSLDIPQIDYFAVGIQNSITKQSISLMSSSEWQKHFTDNDYAPYDPIRRATLSTKRNFIPFSEVDFVDNFGREIMRQRAIFNIKDGLVLMKRFSKHNYMITLGTGFSKFDAYEFLKAHHNKLSVLVSDLETLLNKEIQQFLPKNTLGSTHPSNDAK